MRRDTTGIAEKHKYVICATLQKDEFGQRLDRTVWENMKPAHFQGMRIKKVRNRNCKTIAKGEGVRKGEQKSYDDELLKHQPPFP